MSNYNRYMENLHQMCENLLMKHRDLQHMLWRLDLDNIYFDEYSKRCKKSLVTSAKWCMQDIRDLYNCLQNEYSEARRKHELRRIKSNDYLK